MRTAAKPPREATYVANQLDESWLRTEQRKLYTRSQKEPSYVFEKLWGLITDPRNLRTALARVAHNKGRNTPGVDGVTVRSVLAKGADAFVAGLRADLRSGTFRPMPVRRVLIPKPGQPGKFRPLGIPTVTDRVVQAAMKNILEPIFEADFYPTSYGFRPARSVATALEHLRVLVRPTPSQKGEFQELPYQWAVEGDIKGCFDNIDHHGLMNRVRRRVSDPKTNRLIVAFLKAGVLSEQQFVRMDSGTPQGGILSPLLANIALAAIDERYERWVWPRGATSSAPGPRPRLLTDPKEIKKRARFNRMNDFNKLNRPVLFPVRYADDFLVLVGAPRGSDQDDRSRTVAHDEKAALGHLLKERLNLELAEAKTLVTPVTTPIRFLGHDVVVAQAPTRMYSRVTIPKEKIKQLRRTIKAHFSLREVGRRLGERIHTLNPVLQGWCYFYRYAWGAKRVFGAIDHYVWWTIFRWLRKKHNGVPIRDLVSRFGWRWPGTRAPRWGEGSKRPFQLARVRVQRYRLQWMRVPDFAQSVYGEPGA
jgi:group II intron reverse transcriptase/maturase